jgi:hypothetical protein
MQGAGSTYRRLSMRPLPPLLISDMHLARNHQVLHTIPACY